MAKSLINSREGYVQHQLSTVWNESFQKQYHEDLVAIARAAHTANLLYSQLHPTDVSVCDETEWADMSDESKAGSVSAIVDMIIDPVLTGEQAHAIWLANKQAAGWKFGATKNTAEKTHPCMVPYNELNAWDKTKDDLYICVINSLLRQFAQKVLSIYKPSLESGSMGFNPF